MSDINRLVQQFVPYGAGNVCSILLTAGVTSATITLPTFSTGGTVDSIPKVIKAIVPGAISGGTCYVAFGGASVTATAATATVLSGSMPVVPGTWTNIMIPQGPGITTMAFIATVASTGLLMVWGDGF